MKFLPSLVVCLSVLFASYGQSDYVCLPCGHACDKTTYTKPGTCPDCQMQLVAKSSIHFKNLSLNDFLVRIKNNPKVVLLDVRTAEEFSGNTTEVESFGSFKGAININITDLESRIGELAKYKEAEVLVYCSHSHRSPRASYLLGTKGFKNVSNLEGGVSQIAQSGIKADLLATFIKHRSK